MTFLFEFSMFPLAMVLPRQTAVTAYFPSKKLLLFDFIKTKANSTNGSLPLFAFVRRYHDQ